MICSIGRRRNSRSTWGMRVKDPVFAMAESSFLDGGSRLDEVDLDPLITFSGERSVATPDATLPDVRRSECVPARRAE